MSLIYLLNIIILININSYLIPTKRFSRDATNYIIIFNQRVAHMELAHTFNLILHKVQIIALIVTYRI